MAADPDGDCTCGVVKRIFRRGKRRVTFGARACSISRPLPRGLGAVPERACALPEGGLRWEESWLRSTRAAVAPRRRQPTPAARVHAIANCRVSRRDAGPRASGLRGSVARVREEPRRAKSWLKLRRQVHASTTGRTRRRRACSLSLYVPCACVTSIFVFAHVNFTFHFDFVRHTTAVAASWIHPELL